MATVECGGAAFHYEERGAGPPLLLIPGTGGHTGALASVAERLASSYRTIAYDRRGHGQTTARNVRKDYLARHVADAAALLRALDAQPANVFGWSWGALVALGLAIEHPDLARRLVLHEPPLHVKKHMTFAVARGIGGAILLGKLGMPRRGALRFARFALMRDDGRNSFEELDPGTRESLLANARTIIDELAAGTGEELTVDALARIRCPVALIVGDRSAQVLRNGVRNAQRAMPSATLVHLAGGDHLACINRPDDLARAIGECLASPVSAASPS